MDISAPGPEARIPQLGLHTLQGSGLSTSRRGTMNGQPQRTSRAIVRVTPTCQAESSQPSSVLIPFVDTSINYPSFSIGWVCRHIRHSSVEQSWSEISACYPVHKDLNIRTLSFRLWSPGLSNIDHRTNVSFICDGSQFYNAKTVGQFGIRCKKLVNAEGFFKSYTMVELVQSQQSTSLLYTRPKSA